VARHSCDELPNTAQSAGMFMIFEPIDLWTNVIVMV
jgi:hypothetical protein